VARYRTGDLSEPLAEQLFRVDVRVRDEDRFVPRLVALDDRELRGRNSESLGQELEERVVGFVVSWGRGDLDLEPPIDVPDDL